MNVLTTDNRAKSQLSILLRELGYAASFHNCAETLSGTLAELDASVSERVLIDLDAGIDHAALLQTLRSKGNVALTGFQIFKSSQNATLHPNAEYYPSTVILPAHAERAKSRLRTALGAPGGLCGSASARRASANVLSFSKRTRSPFAMRGASRLPASPPASTAQAFAPARYLVCKSTAGRELLNQIKLGETDSLTTLLLGEDGAEFELVCREINYQRVGDRSPLHCIRPDAFCVESLEKTERQASRERTVLYVYAGRTDEYSAEALHRLHQFINYLAQLRQPHMRIYLAHAYESEAYFHAGVAERFKPLSEKMERMRIPLLEDREDDIPEICDKMIGTLRTAHPFLMVQQISREAVAYLMETRKELNYAKLVRILRNSLALSQKPVLCVDDFKNYGESDLTTQHLLESMADEAYFPAEQSANF
jgi:hypothetical protein